MFLTCLKQRHQIDKHILHKGILIQFHIPDCRIDPRILIQHFAKQCDRGFSLCGLLIDLRKPARIILRQPSVKEPVILLQKHGKSHTASKEFILIT